MLQIAYKERLVNLIVDILNQNRMFRLSVFQYYQKELQSKLFVCIMPIQSIP